MSITLFYLCCYRPDTQSFHFHVLLDALVLSQKDSYVNVAVISLVLLGPDMQSFFIFRNKSAC